MKKSMLGSLALLYVAVSLPAYANTNGVYVQVTDGFYGIEEERRVTDATSGTARFLTYVTKAHKASYACNGSASFTELPEGTGFRYCSRSAEVKLVWRLEIREDSFLTPSIGGPEVTFPESHRVVDDNDAGHCKTGEAVLWDVGAYGAEQPWATMRDYCQYCAYTGGDCE